MEEIDLFHKHCLFRIHDPSDITYARVKLEKYLIQQGVSSKFISDCSIILTELGTNLLKYAQGKNFLLFRFLGEKKTIEGVEIGSINKEPHIANLHQFMTDGATSGTSLGIGLGGIKRLSDSSEFFSKKGLGTCLFSRKYIKSQNVQPLSESTFSWLCTPMRDYEYCGDAIRFKEEDEQQHILVADGLGHGKEADKASAIAAELFKYYSKDHSTMFDLFHARMRGTRGAAVAMATYIPAEKKLLYTGVGNIAGRLYSSSGSKGLISYPGIVGGNMRKCNTLTFDTSEFSHLIMHSDGLRSISKVSNLAHLTASPPLIVSASIYSTLMRDTDDACIATLVL